MQNEQQLRSVLEQCQEPVFNRTLAELKAIKSITFNNQQRAVVELIVGYPIAGYREAFLQAINAQLSDTAFHSLELRLSSQVVAHQTQPGVQPIAGVKNIIAVASGKGGVGKSTTAVNLALALAADGAAVGLLDADIYGPNQPQMLGIRQRPEIKPEKKMLPIMAHGLQTMSIGYLIEQDQPVVWRGPMISKAFEQLLHDTLWQNLDYLIIDMPPGTGDVQLTLGKKMPIAGSVIVTTPQPVALLDAGRALAMFQQMQVTVLGVIENMSEYVCPACGHHESIFGHHGGDQLAQQADIGLLGRLPLDSRLRSDVDQGQPTVIADPRGPLADAYAGVARRLAVNLALQPRDYAAKFGSIAVEHD